MDWQHPGLLFLAIPALVLLFGFEWITTHPMSTLRRRLLLGTRSILVLLVITALAAPAWRLRSREQSLVIVVDQSESVGESGRERAREMVQRVRAGLEANVEVGEVEVAREGRLIVPPGGEAIDRAPAEAEVDPTATNLARGLAVASSVFPTGSSKHVLLITDGQETEGDLEAEARSAAIHGVRVHVLPLAGEQRPDVRVTRLEASQPRINEGASVDLRATVEASFAGTGFLRLFENGVEVDRQPVTLSEGESQTLVFRRSPEQRNIYNFRAVAEGFGAGDTIPANNEALAVVDVRGKPLLLYVEGEPAEARYLVRAMEREGIRLEVRPPAGLPSNPRDLVGYDAVIFSDVAARDIDDARMTSLRDYVQKLGGGFVMVGGPNSFGVGGYYRTPIEEILPVKLRGPDHEEHQSSALALVIDRSGSMSGQKLEICKSAAVATAELLEDKDFLGVYAFDSSVHVVLPMARVNASGSVANQLSLLSSGGGTNIFPGMATARRELDAVKARIKHMIVLTDGQTAGQGYAELASQCHADGITISTVAVGSGAQIGLLQTIAAAGGGKSYVTMDPTAITRIFTQDTMMHTGRLIREEPFQPEAGESHPMLTGWDAGSAPPLLGYVKTTAKPTAQVPLLAADGDPLLAHWRFGLGKVTAFTSDCKSRWAALWLQGNDDAYSRLWSQLLRETARAPQSRFMDLRLAPRGSRVDLLVDLLEDAGTRRNDAEVHAEIFFVPANSLGAGMERIESTRFEQRGPGWYQSSFHPREPGVYLVRARSGSLMMSAGHVHNPSAEVATGRVDQDLLDRVARLSGGTVLASASDPIPLHGNEVMRHVDLWPYLLMTFLGLLLLDVLIRRWENAQGMMEVIGAGFTRPRPQTAGAKR